MIKKTLYFSNPAKLNTQNNQLVVDQKDRDVVTIPIEDIGFVILDHYAIIISQPVLSKLIDNNVAVITTNDRHLPNGMFLNLEGNSVQNEIFRAQIEAKDPIKKRLWQQTIVAKITNQSNLMDLHDLNSKPLQRMVKQVRSGDPDNLEGQAARYYWKRIFTPFEFKRERFGLPPNNLLNYGYAILRAVIARSLVGSGLLPSIGIHHHNRYNAYALADDIMEPYRPFVDELVLNLLINDCDIDELTPDVKKELLIIPNCGVSLDNEVKPLMLSATRTSASLVQCFTGKQKYLTYPVLCD